MADGHDQLCSAAASVVTPVTSPNRLPDRRLVGGMTFHPAPRRAPLSPNRQMLVLCGLLVLLAVTLVAAWPAAMAPPSRLPWFVTALAGWTEPGP
jgi:hypothetical protein